MGTGPIIAQFLRLMDQEAKAGPNRVIGAALGSPVGGLLTAGAGSGTSARIMRNAQAGALGPSVPNPGSSGAETGALSDFYENTPLGALPFFRTVSQTLADPFLGAGPVSELGAPLRGLAEAGIRGGAFGLGAAAHGMGALRGVSAAPDFASVLTKGSGKAGLQTIESAAGPQSMFRVSPQASWQAQAMANVGDFLNQAGLGLPGRTAEYLTKLSGSLFQPATMQKIREAESSYRDLLTTIQQRSDTPFLDWWNTTKSFTPKQYAAQFNNMALAPQQKALFMDDKPAIMAGVGQAHSAQNTIYGLGYDLIKAQGNDPAPAAGMVRLYRGEPLLANRTAPTDGSRTGRWFTPDIEAARQYGEDSYGPQMSRMYYVDVPAPVAAATKVPVASGEEGHVLPSLFAAQAQPVRTGSVDLPAKALETKDGWARVKTGLAEQGIDNKDKLYQAYLTRFGDTARVAQIRRDMEHFDADPLQPGSGLELALAGTLQNMRKGLPETPELPPALSGIGKWMQFANDVQKGQAVASGVYIANNVFQRVFAQVMNGRAPVDALMNQVEGLKRGAELAFGKLDQLDIDRKRLALFPKDITDWIEHMGLTYPAIMEPGNMSNVMGLEPAADELTKVPPMAIQKMGPLYPALMGSMGFITGAFSGGLPGAAIGAAEGVGLGKFTQFITPKIKTMERVTETFGRSFIWKNEAARYANEAMTTGVKGGDPFITQVLDAVENSLKTPYGVIENPGMAGQGIDLAQTGGLRGAFQQMVANTRNTGGRMDDAIHAFLGEHPDLTSATGTPYTLQPPGKLNLSPQPVPAIVHRMPQPEDAQALRQFLQTSGGQVSAKDVQTVLNQYVPGIGKKTINDLTSTWSGMLQDASVSGTAKASHEMIIPRTTTADEYAKYVFLFHYWATRAIPWWGEQMMSSPQYTAILMRQMADSAKEIAYRGLPNSLQGANALIYPQTVLLGGLVHALYGPGTLYWSLDNPFGGGPNEAMTTQVGPGESYNATADVLKVGAALGLKPNATADWLLHIMGLYGPEAPSPDFFRYGPLMRNLPGMLGNDPNMPGRWALDRLRENLSPFIKQNPGDEQDFLIRSRIRELAQSEGKNPHSPEIELASADPNSGLYQQAREDVKREGLMQALTSLTIGPGTGNFMRTQTLQNRQQEETIKQQQGLRSDLGSMFATPLAAREPLMNVYRGLSYTRPPVPELANLISNGFQPQQQDPRTIANNYLIWARGQGIPINQAWDRQNIQRYYQETEMNRRISDAIKAGGAIPLGLPTGPGR